MKTSDPLIDVEVLKKHREYEVSYITKAGGPLSKLIELGPRERPASGQQPAFTFYLWKMVNPIDLAGARQYYLTTLSAGEVVVLTAIVVDDSKDETAIRAFQTFASSFQHILKKEQCPAPRA